MATRGEVAGRLACPDDKFAFWAEAVGVKPSALEDDEKEDMILNLMPWSLAYTASTNLNLSISTKPFMNVGTTRSGLTAC